MACYVCRNVYLIWNVFTIIIKLDVDPERDDDASPMSSYGYMKLRWFQLVNIRQNSILIFLEKKNQILGFPCCSTHDDLSIDVSIANVRLILTKLRWFRLFSTSQNTSQNSISNFFENKFRFLGFYVVVLVKTFPLMYQLLL